MIDVLYISPNGYIGGAESFVLEICKMHLKNKKYNPTILFFNDGKAIPLAKSYGINTYLLSSKFKLSRPILLFQAIIEIRKYLKSNHFKVIHLTMPYAHIVTFFASIFLGIKNVWFQHGPINGMLDQIGILLPCDCVMFNSTYLQNEHNKLIGLKPTYGQKKIHAMVPSQESNHLRINEIRKKIFKKNQKLLIGMAGRITEWKGFHIFLNAIVELRKIIPDNFLNEVHFIIIGSSNSEVDKKYETGLKNYVESNGLNDDVTLTGFVDDINNYMSSLNVFVHSSIIPEPFGLVVAEAMLHGVLVIGSNQGGICEILTDGETGLTFNSTAPNASIVLAELLSFTIKKYIEESFEPAEFKKIINNAKNNIKTNYNLINVYKEVENVYDKLLQKDSLDAN